MTPFTAAQFRTRRAGRSIVIPRAHGGLGYALPATVGAAFARPSERIVGLVGDGSFGMSGLELATIASLRLPITIMVFHNGSFGWIQMLQKFYHGERYLGVDFTGNMDAVAIAAAVGIRGVRIAHSDQLGPAVTEAMESHEPTFIDVPTKSEVEEGPASVCLAGSTSAGETIMAHPRFKCWGWGDEGEVLAPDEVRWLEGMWAHQVRVRQFDLTPPPAADEIHLHPSRLGIPAPLLAICTIEHIADTCEAAVTWEQFSHLYPSVKEATGRAVQEATGQEGVVAAVLPTSTRLAQPSPFPLAPWATSQR